MPLLQILSPKEQREYESPPRITAEDRTAVFSLPEALQDRIATLRSEPSRIGFTLQAAYFRVTGRFFPVNSFRTSDIKHVAKFLGFKTNRLSEKSYGRRTAHYHRQLILSHFGWTPCKGDSRQKIESYACWCAQLQIKPIDILTRLIQSCWDNKIELPGYNTFADIITAALNEFEQETLKLVKTAMTKHEHTFLENILKDEETPTIKILQEAPHSINPSKIKRAVEHYRTLCDLQQVTGPAIEQIGLSDSAIRYFAEWIRKAPHYQLKALKSTERTFLHVACFINDEVRLRADILIDIFLRVVERNKNLVKKRLKEDDAQKRIEREKTLRFVTNSHLGSLEALLNVQETAKSPSISDRQKLIQIIGITEDYFQQENIASKTYLEELKKKIEKEVRDKVALQILGETETKLSNRAKAIFLALPFELSNCDQGLANAINYFRAADGRITADAPSEFASPMEREAIGTKDSFNRSLYTSLLYRYVAEAIRSGALSIPNSYTYRSLEGLLIPQGQWELEKDELIEAAGLADFTDIDKLLETLKVSLSNRYKEVNARIIERQNKCVRRTAKGRYTVATPRLDKGDPKFISRLLQGRQVPIFDVLRQVDGITQFSKALKHFTVKGVRGAPSQATKIAALIGLGCNIHPIQLAQISKGINEKTLINTINWYFSPENLKEVNKKIINATEKLALSSLYTARASRGHTASDGRKVGVSIESLQARYSFKYFGKDKGIAVYSYVDSKQHTFYVDVIDPSKREATFVIDGLVSKVKHHHSDAMHSTDTHGFSEAAFSVLHLMGIYFAPRFARISKQSIYTLSSSDYPAEESQPLKPSGIVSRRKIIEQWDQLLRFVATISLQYATASQLFQRLNSYSHEHPLYQALKEFGRVIKSLYILKFFDDMKLRQNVQWMLNTSENSNRFGRAISFDNGGEFRVRSREQQKVAALSQSVLQNAIIYWNYLYLSQMLTKKTVHEREALLLSLRVSSVMSWRHVNLRGEYDFTDTAGSGEKFNMEAIDQLDLEQRRSM